MSQDMLEINLTSPMYVASIYDITALHMKCSVHAKLSDAINGKNPFERDPILIYIINALMDVLVHDHSIPCEIGLKPIDMIRNSILMFDDELFKLSVTSKHLEVDKLTIVQEQILTTSSMKLVIKDIVRTHAMRCNPDDPISLFTLGESLGVGFRAIKDNE